MHNRGDSPLSCPNNATLPFQVQYFTFLFAKQAQVAPINLKVGNVAVFFNAGLLELELLILLLDVCMSGTC